MSGMRLSPRKRAPAGVVKEKPIALRLLAPELEKHESLYKQTRYSSAGFAREMWLLGVDVYERTQAPSPASATASIRRGA